MNCRGKEQRNWIVENYYVKPVAHIQLLKGQTKHSDAGQIIENNYYIFEAKNKTNEDIVETIQCGIGAARDFLRLLNHSGLPIFNPLHERNEFSQNNEQINKSKGSAETNIKWNPKAKQLYNAIMWLILIIDARPQTPIYNIRDKVLKFKYKEPFDSEVKSINTMIRNSFKNRTLTEKINQLKIENNIREELCEFDKLKTEISDNDGNPIQWFF